MIQYLETAEKSRCKDLWREAFPEDSASFCEYYFEEKMKDNRVLVCEEDGKIVAMLHRNPYPVFMRGDVHTCDYIVGVATAKTERRKGHMRALLLTMFRDMYEEKMPFTFLMPAREGIYRPYDFRYIFDQPRWVLKYNPKIRKENCENEALLPDLADWQNAWLKRQYEVFTLRSRESLQRINKELASEAGSCSLIYDGSRFVGMESEWGLNEREMRFLYTGDAYRDLSSKKPAIMARIICLPEFVKKIRLSEDCPEEEVSVQIGINDLFVPQNQGEWLWTLTKEGSQIRQTSRFIAKSRVEMFTIAELTQWLFSYEIPDQVANIPFGRYIEPFHGVFLDEVV